MGRKKKEKREGTFTGGVFRDPYLAKRIAELQAQNIEAEKRGKGKTVVDAEEYVRVSNQLAEADRMIDFLCRAIIKLDRRHKKEMRKAVIRAVKLTWRFAVARYE